MKIIDWVDYEDAGENYVDNLIGGLGGFFNWEKKGMRWKDYIEEYPDEKDKIYIEALRKEIVKNNLKFTGHVHQNGLGVPLFEDNTVALYSYRAWGDLMAAIWSEEENKDYCYMEFYRL